MLSCGEKEGNIWLHGNLSDAPYHKHFSLVPISSVLFEALVILPLRIKENSLSVGEGLHFHPGLE